MHCSQEKKSVGNRNTVQQWIPWHGEHRLLSWLTADINTTSRLGVQDLWHSGRYVQELTSFAGELVTLLHTSFLSFPHISTFPSFSTRVYSIFLYLRWIILSCTHFPFLPTASKNLPSPVSFIFPHPPFPLIQFPLHHFTSVTFLFTFSSSLFSPGSFSFSHSCNGRRTDWRNGYAGGRQ